MDLLFLGDSITDCGHCFTEDNLGNGYVKYVFRQLSARLNTLTVTNGGSDGFTFPRILQKWRNLYSQAYYDIVVIAGGINEASVMMDTGLTAGQASLYLRNSIDSLRRLIYALLANHPEKILVLEPFLFSYPDYLTLWRPCCDEVCKRIRQTVNSFCTDTVQSFSVQNQLDYLVHENGISQITTDGIHLTSFGHECLGQIVAANILGKAENPS